MDFTTLRVELAEGCLLAHSLTVGDHRLRKGHRLCAGDLTRLAGEGVKEVIVVSLGPDDLAEDQAAEAVAALVTGEGLEASKGATGRVNLYAKADGLLDYDAATLNRINAVDEAVTLSALQPGSRVEAGQLAATIKIIPLAVEAAAIERLRVQTPASFFRLAAFRPKAVGLLQTLLPGLGAKVLEKTRAVTAAKLEQLGARLTAERVVPHEVGAVAKGLASLAAEGCEILLVLGASATTDRKDIIPSAITASGGRIERFGMPVDPGNLLLVAQIGERPVLALPGSARSPRIGGNDWVLWRVLADLPVTSQVIAAMGAGGLLKENPARPLPRVVAAPRRRIKLRSQAEIAAVVLAAGRSSRMGGQHKLLARLGETAVIARTMRAVLASRARPVVVVTGAHAEAVTQAISPEGVWQVVQNHDYAEGMGGSLAAGIAALPARVEGALIVLGDMPLIKGETLDRLAAAFQPDLDQLICVPSYRGKRGHPVLFARRYFPELAALTGDRGARDLLRDHAESVVEVPVEDEGVVVDLDTPEALDAARRRFASEDF